VKKFTEAEKELIRDRHQAGARETDRPRHGQVELLLAEVDQHVGRNRPRPRVRSELAIARSMGRAPSTISREVNANGGRRGYRALKADGAAYRRARRPKVAKIAACSAFAGQSGGKAGQEVLSGDSCPPRENEA
jgi:hypothetical protein